MEELKNEILRKDTLLALPDNTAFAGYALMSGYSVQPAKNNTTYLVGNLNCIGTVPFKVWSGPLHDLMVDESYTGKICRVNGKVNEYNGTKSVILDNCLIYDGPGLEPDDFLEFKYDIETLYNDLRNVLIVNCKPVVVDIFDAIINPYKDRFCKEFAAVSHHDSCPGGLLAHTYKVVRLVEVYACYNDIMVAVDKDLLFLAAALHDIGKVKEYYVGSISEIGMMMSHLTLGVGMIEPHKDLIVQAKGIEFYNALISVIQQHHGDYGERPRTLVAYLIHLIDGFEAQMTDINDALGNAPTTQVKIADYKLSF